MDPIMEDTGGYVYECTCRYIYMYLYILIYTYTYVYGQEVVRIAFASVSILDTFYKCSSGAKASLFVLALFESPHSL